MAQLKSTNITGNLAVTGNILASKIIKLNGTAHELLLADGSIANISTTAQTVAPNAVTATSGRTYLIQKKDGQLVVNVPWNEGTTGALTEILINPGTGLSGGGTIDTSGASVTLNHSNSVTAITTESLLKLKYDTEGHITGTTAITKADITGLGIPSSDTGATSIEVTGTGNAVTAASYDATTRKITLTKGSTFLTSHQSLAAYVKGPSTSTDTAIALFSGTDGKTIKNSNLTVNANDDLSGISKLYCGEIHLLAESQPTILASQLGSAITVEGIETPVIYAPTTSGGTTYGVGTNGQVLKSNGTTVYWGTDNSGSGGLTSLPTRLAANSSSSVAANNALEQGWYYINDTANRPPFKQVDGLTGNDYRIMTTAYGNTWLQQIATDFRSNDMFIRRIQNGTWQPWTAIVRTLPCTVSGTTHSMPSITDNAIVRWATDRTATIQNSGVTIDDSNNLTVPGKLTISNTTDSSESTSESKDNSTGALIVNGAAVIKKTLVAAGGIVLDNTTTESTNLQYLLGIDAFASGGKIRWARKGNVSVGYADECELAVRANNLDGGTNGLIYITSNGPIYEYQSEEYPLLYSTPDDFKVRLRIEQYIGGVWSPIYTSVWIPSYLLDTGNITYSSTIEIYGPTRSFSSENLGFRNRWIMEIDKSVSFLSSTVQRENISFSSSPEVWELKFTSPSDGQTIKLSNGNKIIELTINFYQDEYLD